MFAYNVLRNLGILFEKSWPNFTRKNKALIAEKLGNLVRELDEIDEAVK